MPLATGSIFFVADVHWQPVNNTLQNYSSPLGLFGDFLNELSQQARVVGGIKLYVLGDLFDYWLECRNKPFTFYNPHIEALARAHDAGVHLHLLFGNRDFAYGNVLKDLVGATIVGNNIALKLGDKHLWLEHGDLLCSRDFRYQIFRKAIRNPLTRLFASLFTQAQLNRFITSIRRASTAEIQRKKPASLAIVEQTVLSRIKRGYDIVMCGHVHQASQRVISDTKNSGELITLGSWGTNEGWYACFSEKLELKIYKTFK
ncbi:MAG: UDP-2,3-diacylglucosamine diphosphatase [Deltaproteobacteria bacterium]|nr:UDP-2,3-diacylglucosamine diphosphatase [Deltaproteobacteria bacterium]